MPTPYDSLTLREKIMLDHWPVSEVEEFGHDKKGEGYRLSSGMRGKGIETMPRHGKRGPRPDPTYYA